MTILFLTTVLPGGRRTGSEVASQAFVDALRAAGHRVVVVGYRRAGGPAPTHADDIAVGERPIETRTAGLRPAWWWGRGLARGLPYSAAKYVSRRYGATASRLVDSLRPGLVIVDHAQVAWAISDGPAPRPYVYLAHNVEHELYAEQAAARTGAQRRVYARESRRVADIELALAGAARQVWALTREDAAVLGPPDRARAFDLPAGGLPELQVPDAEVDVALLGTWTWSANAGGLDWFLDVVVPQLPTELSVEVAGTGSERARGRHDAVTARGPVDEVGAFLRRARVVAVPSQAGAGVQVKSLDAIASGRRVVATTVAMRGISAPPRSVSIADAPGDFAAALVQATTDYDDDALAPAVRGWLERRRAAFDDAVAAAVEELVEPT
jgi:glycosyl transferase family 1